MRMLAVDVEHGEHRLEPVWGKAVDPRLHVLRLTALLTSGVPANQHVRIANLINFTMQSHGNMLL